MSPAMAVSVSTKTKEDGTLEGQFQKGVKYLSETGLNRLPKKYIWPVSDRPNVNDGKLKELKKNLKLPIIDFAELQGSNRPQILESLANACEQYGFFQLVNHGTPGDVISNMVDAGTRFFELPMEERAKYMSSDMRSPVRYGTSFNQKLDSVFCWRDFLKLMCHPLPEVLPHWPSSPVELRRSAATYAKETKHLFLMLMEAILESLGLSGNGKNKTEEDDILKHFQGGSQLMVVNCYPPCPEPNLTLGMPPHSDYGFLTLLLQDEVEGLQIQFQEKWVTVEPIANSFVVNVGDHLEIFSNGKYKSVLHRVSVNSTRPRMSVASLHTLPSDNLVRPSLKLIGEANPRRYKDTDFNSFLDYVTSCESKGKSFLETRKME